MKFQLPDQLPTDVTELGKLVDQATKEINVFQARKDAGDDDFTPEEIERLEYLIDAHKTVTTARDEADASAAEHAQKLNGLFDRAAAATKPAEKPAAEKAPEKPTEKADDTAAEDKSDGGGQDAADVVAEAEAATAEAAECEPVVAAAAQPVSFGAATRNSDVPAGTPADEGKPRRWALTAAAPNFAEHTGLVDTAAIAEGICSPGRFTGLNPDARTVLATMERPSLPVHDTADEFYADLDRITAEGLNRGGQRGAGALVAAGGWCAPSEQEYGFCPTAPPVGLLSFPEKRLNRGGVIFPGEPDFSSLQTGFHFTEPELEAVDGQGNPTAIKNIVEIPCPPEMIEYRLEALGWGVKSGILQKRAWPELVQKFLDEFMVEHQYRISAKSLLKVLAQSSAAKVVPTDAVLGATTGILNGLHVRARNIQIKGRTTVVEGIAPIWFRDVLKADLAGRDGLDVLSVTDAQVDSWLAARGIYLQYEGRWQSLGAGQPGHEDNSWWPGSVDVVLYPAGTFWRALNNVVTLGVQMPFDLLRQNRQLEGFVEDEFQVGKRCGPSHLIRIPLCVNGAVGAREVIDCSTGYAAKVSKTVSVSGGPTGGNFGLKFSATNVPASVNYNASAANVDTALTGIDDGVTQAGDITTTGGPLPGTPVVVTYPARLGSLQVDTKALTGGTSPDVAVS